MSSIVNINIDRQLCRLTELLDQPDTDSTLAFTIQDLPKIESARLKDLTYDLLGKHFQVLTKSIHTNKKIKAATVTIINTNQTTCIKEANQNTNHISYQMCTLKLLNNNDRLINLINVYIKPKTSYDELKRGLEDVEQFIKESTAGQSATIFAGDINSSSPEWDNSYLRKKIKLALNEHHYSKTKENRGRVMSRFFEKNNLRAVRLEEPTFKESSVIDIIALGHKIERKVTQIMIDQMETGNGHNKITLMLNITNSNLNKANYITRTIINPNKLKQDDFKELEIRGKELKQHIQKNQLNNQELKDILDQHTQELIGLLHNLQIKATTTKKITKRKKRITQHGMVRIRIESLHKKEKTKPKQKRQREKLFKFRNELIREISRASMGRCSEDQAVKFYEKRSANMSEITTSNNEITNTDIDELARSKFPFKERNKAFEYQDKEANTTINDREIDEVLYECRKKKYKGPDGLRFDIVTKAYNSTKEYIAEICKLSYKTATVPRILNTTKGQIIPKKAAGKFRIVHIAHPLTAIIERIALHKLERKLENMDAYNKRQYGFTAIKDRHDMIARILAMTTKHKILHQYTGITNIVSLDIEGAFDNVDQNSLTTKIIEELKPEPWRFWLANFITTRKIKIKIGNRESKPIDVCRGVPQGSALGPILWNFAINKLDANLTEKEKTEILQYADDIVIVHNQDKTSDNSLQWILDSICKRLSDQDLRISTEKTVWMPVEFRTGNRNALEHYYIQPRIYNQNIKQVGDTNILGIHVDKRLNLKTDSYEDSINQTIHKLFHVNYFELIHTNKEWLKVIDSHIISRTVINFWPILMIDNKARVWSERKTCESIKKIFRWSTSTPNKFVRCITGTPSTQLLIRKLMIRKITAKDSDAYKALISIMNADHISNKEWRQIKTYDMQLICRLPNKPRYREPNNYIKTTTTTSNSNNLKWALFNGRKSAIAAEYIGTTIIKQLGIYNTTYSISYFNVLTAISEIVKRYSQPRNQTKIIQMHEKDSILQALNNMRNTDWRIIRLRDKMAKWNWQIEIINFEQITTIEQKLLPAINRNIQPEGIDNPNFSDYADRYEYKKLYNESLKEEGEENITQLMKIIHDDPEDWQKLTLAWIEADTAMALSGIIKVRNSNEIRKETFKIPTYDKTLNGCSKSNCSLECSERDTTDTHATLHRLFNCEHKPELRIEIIDLKHCAHETAPHVRRTKTILNDKRLSQKFTKLITAAAFDKEI